VLSDIQFHHQEAKNWSWWSGLRCGVASKPFKEKDLGLIGSSCEQKNVRMKFNLFFTDSKA